MVTAVINRIATTRIWSQRRDRLARRRLPLLVVGVFLTICAVFALWGFFWYRDVQQQYRDVRANADAFRVRYEHSAQPLGPGDLPQLTNDLTDLETQLRGLQDRIDVPVLSGIARHAPYVGDRYNAVEDVLALGVELTSIAREATEIANEARLAVETSGIRVSDAPDPTWLDVVMQREPEIRALEARFQQSLLRRERIDVDALPPQGQTALQAADTLIAKASRLRDECFGLLPLLAPAFGRDQDARYLILLQNGEEIRPSGGFPGTFGLLTIRNGRIVSLEIDDIRTLDLAYHDARETPLPSPGPIRTYLRQEEWLPHDALWSPDFSEAAQAFLSMYGQTGWPELTGVIGVNHDVVQSVLNAVGPYEVMIDGRPVTVGADSFLQVIESYRDLTWQDLAAHKRVVGALGAALLDHISAADFETKKAIYFGLRADADRREVQMYFLDPSMQSEVVKRHWHGPLDPDPSTPTLALTVASVAGGKSSIQLYPQSRLEIERDLTSGNLRATWTVSIEHRGDPEGDPAYHGFQRLWVSVFLPDGAQVVSLSRRPDPPDISDDSRAIGFNIGVMPGATEQLRIVVELPAAVESLLLRRQAGMNDMVWTVDVESGDCRLNATQTAIADLRVDLEPCEVRRVR